MKNELYHSGKKGMKWKKHKYIKVVNGNYYYVDENPLTRLNAKKNAEEARRYYNEKKKESDYSDKVFETAFSNEQRKRKNTGVRNFDDEQWTKKKLLDVYQKNREEYEAERAYKRALERYKKSPIRKMKTAIRVGKSRVTNTINHMRQNK